MQSDEEELDSHTIELADTRPTMLGVPFLGEVPTEIGALLIMFSGVLAGFRMWFFVPIGPAVWWLISLVIAYDYHIMTRVSCWLKTSAWSLDSGRHGGSSTTPFPRTSSIPRGMTNGE